MNANAAARMGSTEPLALALALAQPKAEVQTNVRAAQAPAALAPALSAADVSHVIEMAWADEIAFEAIALQYGLNEAAVIRLMRRHLKPSSFRLWRKRVTGRASKHSTRQAHAGRHHPPGH